jgi:hypothetical protein
MTRLALVCAIAVGLLVPPAAGAYSWPLRPFNRQHAVRGYFDDPRISGPSRSFHFGIDIPAQDMEPVYAVRAGRAFVRSGAVSIRSPLPGRLSYTHIVPAVRQGQFVARHQVIGHVTPGAEHLHFAEFRKTTHINPLRIDGLAPYTDDTVPQIPALTFYSANQPLQPERVTGVVDVAVDAFDLSPLPLPPPGWEVCRLAPALIRWRILRDADVIRPWRTSVDFRYLLVPSNRFSFVYTPRTYQNRAYRPGRYEYYLARDLDTAMLPNGAYVVEVEAWDTQENAGRGSFTFTVANP